MFNPHFMRNPAQALVAWADTLTHEALSATCVKTGTAAIKDMIDMMNTVGLIISVFYLYHINI